MNNIFSISNFHGGQCQSFTYIFFIVRMNIIPFAKIDRNSHACIRNR